MNYQESLSWLEKQMPKAVSLQFPGARGLERAKRLMALLGNPQNQVPVIHIAGTSGKGSTGYLISMLLEAHGFAVGLSLSPYILDVRERFQLNNRLPDKALVAQALTAVRNVAQQMDDAPTYFEIVTAAAYQLFATQGCDYVVMETGLGGTYDATNVVTRPDKVAVITRIGFDHMSVLGNTLPKIAAQKAGIIGQGNLTVALAQDSSVNQVIEQRVNEVGAHCDLVDTKTGSLVQTIVPKTVVTYSPFHSSSGMGNMVYDPIELELGLMGEHQVENATVALRVIEQLSVRDGWGIDWTATKHALKHTHLRARLDVIKRGNQTIVIDGAHNPQKMAALLTTIDQLFPQQKPRFLLAFKEGKESAAMLEQILPYADGVVLTTFTTNQDSPIQSVSVNDLRGLATTNPDAAIDVIDNPEEALKQALVDDRPLVISGSLYFCATMYPLLREETE